MKIHLDKDARIISLTIIIGLILMFSVFQGHAQGQSCNKILINKKVQNSYERYIMLLKTKYCIPPADTIKYPARKKAVQGGSNSMKRIKKGVSYMLISKNSNEMKNNTVREFCYLPGSIYSNFACYDESK
jgi:hypothetical protein